MPAALGVAAYLRAPADDASNYQEAARAAAGVGDCETQGSAGPTGGGGLLTCQACQPCTSTSQMPRFSQHRNPLSDSPQACHPAPLSPKGSSDLAPGVWEAFVRRDHQAPLLSGASSDEARG